MQVLWNESVTIHLDPEKFLPKPSWMPMAGTETLLLNSLALPPAWLDMLNLLIFFFLPLKLKRKHLKTVKYISQWLLLVTDLSRADVILNLYKIALHPKK